MMNWKNSETFSQAVADAVGIKEYHKFLVPRDIRFNYYLVNTFESGFLFIVFEDQVQDLLDLRRRQL